MAADSVPAMLFASETLVGSTYGQLPQVVKRDVKLGSPRALDCDHGFVRLLEWNYCADSVNPGEVCELK